MATLRSWKTSNRDSWRRVPCARSACLCVSVCVGVCLCVRGMTSWSALSQIGSPIYGKDDTMLLPLAAGEAKPGDAAIGDPVDVGAMEVSFKFVTRVFFYTMRSLHLGLVQLVLRYRGDEQRLGRLQFMLQRDPSLQVRV